MCVFVVKPAGVKPPTLKTLEICWDNNPDGAGYCYFDKDSQEIVIRKGLMTWSAFQTSYENALKRVGEDAAFLIHFRITSVGATCAEQTHPFPVSNSIDALKKSRIKTKFAMVHNGTMGISHDKGESDTQSFMRNVVYPLYNSVGPDMLKSKKIRDMMQFVSGSKLAFMDDRGRVTLVGAEGGFIEDSGVFYSNSTFRYTYYRTLGRDMYSWDSYTGYGEKSKGYGFTSTTNTPYIALTNKEIIEEIQYALDMYSADLDLLDEAECRINQLEMKYANCKEDEEEKILEQITQMEDAYNSYFTAKGLWIDDDDDDEVVYTKDISLYKGGDI